jgi:hypothetical protein
MEDFAWRRLAAAESGANFSYVKQPLGTGNI